MTSDDSTVQAFQEMLLQYFPLDAVQVLEDVRVSRSQSPQIGDLEADLLLGSLSASLRR